MQLKYSFLTVGFLLVILSSFGVNKIIKNFHISRDPLVAKSQTVVIETGVGSLGPSIAQPVVRQDIIQANKNQPFPTNTWWSSVLTANFPETLFSLPFATKLTENGIGTGAPTVTSSAQTFSTPYSEDISIQFPGQKISKASVVSWGAFSVTFSLLDTNNEPIATIDMIKGSPVLRITSNSLMNIVTKNQFPIGSTAEVPAITTIDGRTYLISSTSQLSAAQTNTLQAKAGRVTISALPNKYTSETLKAFQTEAQFSAPTTSVSNTSSELNLTTNLEWHGAKSNEKHLTLLLPHQYNDSTRNLPSLGTYQTIRGNAQLITANILSISYPISPPSEPKSIPKESNFFQKSVLETYLSEELKSPREIPVGSYYGAKGIYRLAKLYETALTVESPTAEAFSKQLETELTNWFTYSPNDTGKHFRYETNLGGIMAANPEYGSDQYNDHHFHYGYFIYAASVLSEHNKAFRTTYSPMINLLVRDIAANSGDTLFPTLRNFDPYEGHSWAGGINRFADGNNQESSSEAIAAWSAVARWSKLDGNSELRTRALSLQTQEINATSSYWFGQNPQSPFPKQFSSPLVSLLWSGKADYATWFSDKPEAKIGIQLLPVGSQSSYLSSLKLPSEVTKLLKYSTIAPWKDILVMTTALQNPKLAGEAFNPKDQLDESNSLPSYYLWVAQHLQ